MKHLLLGIALTASLTAVAQKKSKAHIANYSSTDSVFIKQLYNEALSNGHAHENLRFLCKNIGARLSGSVQAQMAVE
mgnify:FL=1